MMFMRQAGSKTMVQEFVIKCLYELEEEDEGES
jgi:hypothetical protein